MDMEMEVEMEVKVEVEAVGWMNEWPIVDKGPERWQKLQGSEVTPSLWPLRSYVKKLKCLVAIDVLQKEPTFDSGHGVKLRQFRCPQRSDVAGGIVEILQNGGSDQGGRWRR